MTTLKVVQNDKLYDLAFTLTNSSNAVIDLTGATGKLKVQNPFEDTLAVNGNLTIVDAENGQVKYTVQDGDFATSGKHKAEVEITYTGTGKVITFPDIIIDVVPELPTT